MRRALSLNPNHAEMLADVAIHISGMDRVDEAYELAQHALQLDPNFPSWVYFVHTNYFYRKQRYREALAAAQQINMPDFYWTHFWLGCSYAQLGELDKARAEGAEVLRLKPDFGWLDGSASLELGSRVLAHAAEGATKAGMPLHRPDTK